VTDLDEKEMKHVRSALRYLRRRAGGWVPVAKALGFTTWMLEKVSNGRAGVSAKMAFRVARLAGVPVDDLLAGRYAAGVCPRCGYVPDFADEPTVCDGAPIPEPFGSLKLVK
jgi:hypothetical protein